MSNRSRINRKFERFLGYNSDNEIRPDTKGALYSEVQESERRNRKGQNMKTEGMIKLADITYYPDAKKVEVKDSLSSDIMRVPSFGGEHIYNFKNQTEKYFEYKSRGKK